MECDPLGEIQRLAKQLWRDAGRPEERTWEDFCTDAEELLLSGRSQDPQHVKTVKYIRRAKYEDIPGEIFQLMRQDADDFLSVLASAFQKHLSEHESVCLFHLLRTHVVDMPHWKAVGPLSAKEIASLLAHLGNEYSDKKEIPQTLESRTMYWQDRLAKIEKEDAALSFHDRNTMARLMFLLEEEPRVLAVTAV